LQIVDNFVLIHRKHVHVFQRLKVTVLRTLDMWSASDLAGLCHAWAQLGFLHEDLCLAMAGRVTETVDGCNPQQLTWLLDAYATARCSVDSVTATIVRATFLLLEKFTLKELCLHASSFARLNLQHRELLHAMSLRFVSLLTSCSDVSADRDWHTRYAARDLALMSYALAKLGCASDAAFAAISKGAVPVMRDFTAQDIRMVFVAYQRANYFDAVLQSLSLEAHRRIAQFSAESLTLTLSSMAYFGMSESSLFTRSVAQLPRMILTFKPHDVTLLVNTFAAAQVHSAALFDTVTPFIKEKAPFFTPSNWVHALKGYSLLGLKDSMFLSTFKLHLEASKLSLQQLSMAMVYCSKLSFAGTSKLLVEATEVRANAEGVEFPTDIAAQMYCSLLLLGHSSGGRPEAVHRFLSALGCKLRIDSTDALSLSSCVNLCYSMLRVPPVRSASGGGSHPFNASELLARCIREAQELSSTELVLLHHALGALEAQPCNRYALSLRNLQKSHGLPDPSLAHGVSGLSSCGPVAHLAPHFVEPCTHGDEAVPAATRSVDSKVEGVFWAAEVVDALAGMSNALTHEKLPHKVVLGREPHIVVRTGDVALVWGSSLHYIDGTLSPIAMYEKASLRASLNAHVIVVPHWWWDKHGTIEEQGQALARVVKDPHSTMWQTSR